MNTFFSCLGILNEGEGRGTEGNISPLFPPFSSFLFTPKMRKTGGEGKIFNNSPPFPSIPSYNISKQGGYKSPSFPSLPLHYLPLSSPPFPLSISIQTMRKSASEVKVITRQEYTGRQLECLWKLQGTKALQTRTNICNLSFLFFLGWEGGEQKIFKQ